MTVQQRFPHGPQAIYFQIGFSLTQFKYIRVVVKWMYCECFIMDARWRSVFGEVCEDR